VVGDLLKPDSYQQALQTVETVFHSAGLVGLRNGDAFFESNLESTRQLIATLKSHAPQLKRVVMVSSIAAVERPAIASPPYAPLTEATDPAPSTDYGKSKLEAERLLQASGLPYTILRPAYIYGPYPRLGSGLDRVLQDLRNGKPYTRYPFPGRVSEIEVTDLAEALWVASQTGATLNKTYFIANPNPASIADFLSTVTKKLNLPELPQARPRKYLRRYLERKNPKTPLVKILFEDYFVCDASAFLKDTSFVSKTSLKAGIERMLAWYNQNAWA
jgi:nucleoside-diphosphate-sugar epimerase